MYDGKGIIDQETLKSGVKDADALISLLSTNVDKDVIDAGNKLKIIANYGADLIMSILPMLDKRISTLLIRPRLRLILQVN